MSHPIYRVRSFEIVGDYTLCIRFDDATTQTIGFLPILAGELYGPLRNLKLFDQVCIDPDVGTLVWPNGADFDPATLHDWPVHQQAFSQLARRWSLLNMGGVRQRLRHPAVDIPHTNEYPESRSFSGVLCRSESRRRFGRCHAPIFEVANGLEIQK